jgi:excisionase family DNA binding protein
MTSEEVAELFHVDPVTIRRLVTKGELSTYRIGADYRFAPSDLADYLLRQRIVAPAQNESGARSSNPLDQITQMSRKILQGKHIALSNLIGRSDLFTKGARHALTLAQEEALHFHHDYIGTEHLLLGLVREEDGVAFQVLSKLGIQANQIRDTIISIIERGKRTASGEPQLTLRAKKAIEFAIEEAHNFSHNFVGTEHILLGLMREGNGISASVLESFNLRLQQVRIETLRVIKEQQPDTEEIEEAEEAETNQGEEQ